MASELTRLWPHGTSGFEPLEVACGLDVLGLASSISQASRSCGDGCRLTISMPVSTRHGH